MPDLKTDTDPAPIPPIAPDDNACCNSGCDPCVWDLYSEELERYRTALRTWEERHAAKSKGAEAASS